MLLFLEGIVPNTGYLAINASEEQYQDYRTCFPTADWNFNYQTQTIRIPIMKGTLSFIFGSQEVTQNFPSNGVYDVQFASDWNSIFSITKIANINSVTLSPVTLQTITRPTPTPSPTPIPTPSATSFPSLSQSPSPTHQPSHNPSPTPEVPEFPSIIIIALLVTATLAIAVEYRRKANPNHSA
jgi:hypothetical protein